MPSTNLSLELLPMDAPPDAPKPAPPEADAPSEIEIAPLSDKRVAPPTEAPKIDRFLQEATNQYTEGHLDQPLWDRALAQANGDKEAAVATYLQARAVALRLLDRERRSNRRAHAAEAVRNQLDKATEQDDFAVSDLAKIKRRFAIARYRNALYGGGVLLVLLVAWGLYSFVGGSSPAENTSVRTTPAGQPGSARAAAAAASAKSAKAPVAKAKQTATPELMRKIQDLRAAQNWNVLVFYLVEWTRVEPENPEAWDELRADYLNLKQYDDALNAAKQARDLAPKDPRMWRNLGRVQQAIDDPTAALASYGQAATLDEGDATSFREMGILNAQLGRLPEAKAAFDKALALRPDDVPALCMRPAVGQLSSAPQDAYMTAKRAREIDKHCRGS
jgi:tetratricopeptide (TPR) repeat protein